ncbi:MAG: ATP-binding protein [Anaerolineae bacterium]
MLVGTVFGAGALILVDRVVLLPLSNLSERVRYVDVNNDFAMRLPISGRDELTQLALAINTMLSTVSQSRAALQELNVELEQRVMERTTELEDQKSQLQAIMDAMGEGLVYSVDGVIQYVNGAFVELVDYRVRDLVGKPFRSLTSQPNVEPTARRYETALSRSNGTTVQVAVTAMPVEEFDDRQRLVIIVRDITQELKAKAQKEYFFARASHDLRSPLTSIMTRLYLLEKKPEQLETHLKILNRTSERMLELVNDLLDVSRVEQGALVLARRNIVLQSVIEDVVEVQQADAEMRGVRLNLKSDDAPLNVYADPLRINQVVTNLVANAIHYTPEGGRIDVTVERVTVDAAQYAVINVADSGIGISREHLDHIFDPFFRVDGNQENGSGLGLYIVKEIVQLHSGKVSVESEIGKGTTFSVYLTLSSDQSADGETSTEATVSAESAAAIR